VFIISSGDHELVLAARALFSLDVDTKHAVPLKGATAHITRPCNQSFILAEQLG
jgi:hypothetical protein